MWRPRERSLRCSSAGRDAPVSTADGDRHPVPNTLRLSALGCKKDRGGCFTTRRLGIATCGFALCQDFLLLLTKPAQRGVFGSCTVARSGSPENPVYVAGSPATGSGGDGWVWTQAFSQPGPGTAPTALPACHCQRFIFPGLEPPCDARPQCTVPDSGPDTRGNPLAVFDYTSACQGAA